MAYAKTADGKFYKDANGLKVSTDNYTDLPEELWNSTTVLAYLNMLNEEKFGTIPMILNMQQARAFIKRDLTKYGASIIKTFLSAAVKAYTGNRAYPTLSYAQAMLLYGEKLLPKIIKDQELLEKASEGADQSEDEIEW